MYVGSAGVRYALPCASTYPTRTAPQGISSAGVRLRGSIRHAAPARVARPAARTPWSPATRDPSSSGVGGARSSGRGCSQQGICRPTIPLTRPAESNLPRLMASCRPPLRSREKDSGAIWTARVSAGETREPGLTRTRLKAGTAERSRLTCVGRWMAERSSACEKEEA